MVGGMFGSIASPHGTYARLLCHNHIALKTVPYVRATVRLDAELLTDAQYDFWIGLAFQWEEELHLFGKLWHLADTLRKRMVDVLVGRCIHAAKQSAEPCELQA